MRTQSEQRHDGILSRPMPPTSAEGTPDPVDGDIRRLLDGERRRHAADARRREHWLRRQSAEEGTFASVLADLAERRCACAVHTGAGRAVQGTLAGLGVDYVRVRASVGERVLIPHAAITAVRQEPGSAPSTGDRRLEVGGNLLGALGDLSADEVRVALHLRDGEAITGRLGGVGVDVITVRTDAGATYVPVAALNDVTVP